MLLGYKAYPAWETKMNLLFICRYNRFRSKVAEAIFNKLNEKKESKARSRGIILDKERDYVEKNVIVLLKEKGYGIKNTKPLRICERAIEWADKIIVVADNVEYDFGNKEIEVWKVQDCNANEKEKIKKIIEQIESKVKILIKSL